MSIDKDSLAIFESQMMQHQEYDFKRQLFQIKLKQK